MGHSAKGAERRIPLLKECELHQHLHHAHSDCYRDSCGATNIHGLFPTYRLERKVVKTEYFRASTNARIQISSDPQQSSPLSVSQHHFTEPIP